MVRTDTGGDGELKVLRLGETLSGEVARVEAGGKRLSVRWIRNSKGT